MTCRFIRLVAHRAGITASEKLALMVAALCHDMDHPGKRNAHAADNGHGSQIHIRLNLRACGECKCVKVAFVFKGQACYFFWLYSGQCIAKMV